MADEPKVAEKKSRKKTPNAKKAPKKARGSMLSRLVSFVGKILVVLPLIYATLIIVLTTPWAQHQLVFLNYVNFPRGYNLSEPEAFGWKPGMVHAIRLPFHSQVDNATIELGVWHMISGIHHQRMERQKVDWMDAEQAEKVYDDALKLKDTFIYLHGNAANRAARHRRETYDMIATELNANVIAFDYRGFGDSTGWPSEEGVVEDAYEVWKWAIAHGAPPNQITIMGHSLGTAVATQLVAKLSQEKTPPRALILKGGFISVPDVAFDFGLFGLINLLGPVRNSLTLRELAWNVVIYPFHTQKYIKDVTCPILIIHGRNDEQIPAFHSKSLFEAAFLQRRQPSWDVVEGKSQHGSAYSREHPAAKVQYVEMYDGAHNDLHRVDGIWPIIWQFLNTYAPLPNT